MAQDYWWPACDLEDLFHTMVHDLEATVRGAIAAARVALRSWDGEDRTPERALRAVEAWVRCPDEQHAQMAKRAGKRAQKAGRNQGQDGHPAFESAAQAASVPASPEPMETATAAAREAAKTTGEQDVDLAVLKQVWLWLSGQGDPLAQ